MTGRDTERTTPGNYLGRGGSSYRDLPPLPQGTEESAKRGASEAHHVRQRPRTWCHTMTGVFPPNCSGCCHDQETGRPRPSKIQRRRPEEQRPGSRRQAAARRAAAGTQERTKTDSSPLFQNLLGVCAPRLPPSAIADSAPPLTRKLDSPSLP